MNPLTGDAIVKYIDEHLNEKLTLARLSEHFHFSAATLQTYFHRRFNQPLKAYVTEQRRWLSYKLLVTTPDPVKAVAITVGLKSSSTFCHFFRKEFGISPEKFRQAYHDAARLLF